MKKKYIIPQMSIVQLEQEQFLLNYSGPANASEFDILTDFDSESELDI